MNAPGEQGTVGELVGTLHGRKEEMGEKGKGGETEAERRIRERKRGV